MTEEYVSPWRLPPVQCNDREDAVKYPYCHEDPDSAYSSRSKCPYHYRRPDRMRKIPELAEPEWVDWAMYRDRYAEAIDQENLDYFMKHMLDCVTLTVPPAAPVTRRVKNLGEWKLPSDRILVIVSCLAVVFAVTAFLAILL